MILSGWKEIAHHLGRGVRTVQRWDRLGLPVRRPNHKNRTAVCAFSEEVDDWLRATALSDSEHAKAPSGRRWAQAFGSRILIVDDDEAVLFTTAATLFREGYDVRTARDGFEALAVLRSGVPDLLISDLKMPNMSGFELLSIVRKRFPAISVIAISGEFSPGSSSPDVIADRYLEKGAKSQSELKKWYVNSCPSRPYVLNQQDRLQPRLGFHALLTATLY